LGGNSQFLGESKAGSQRKKVQRLLSAPLSYLPYILYTRRPRAWRTLPAEEGGCAGCWLD
jgi:hypothetical protein